MHDSGGANVDVFGILMTSAVAMFFSWSGATDLSDLWVQFVWLSCFPRPLAGVLFLTFQPG